MASNDTLGQKYQAVEYVAHGAFGVVASVTCRESGDPRAIKLVECNDPYVLREINVLTELRFHYESIVRYYESFMVETGTINGSWETVLRNKYRRGFPTMMMAIELELCNGE